MTRSIVVPILAAALAIAACGSDSSGSDGSATTTSVSGESTTTDGATSTIVETAPGVPSTPDEAAAFVLDLINGSMLTEAEYEANFATVFRDAFGFDNFVSLAEQLAADGPWTQGATRSATDTTGSYEMTSALDALFVLDVSVSASGEGIDGLFLSPGQPYDPPASVDEAITRLTSLGRLRAVVADASNGACAPVVNSDATEVMPLGSAFKLYVLGAVVKALDDGSIGWDTKVVINDELDSLPSGTTQDVEPGTEMTIRELAELMISISDNTATDHLINLVGRDAVESILVPMGNDAIERNRPFLTTRDLFVLKFTDPELGERYAVADESERRVMLEGEIAGAPLPDLSQFDPSQPVLVEELEWFASPVAMCDAMVWLTADPIAREILAMNPGVPATSDDWETIAFKGGSEPGLMAMIWWTTTPEGRSFVTAGSVVSSSGPIDEFEAANLFAFLRDRGPALDEVGESD